MNIIIHIPDTPECLPDDEVLCEISQGVQGALTLMTVDMSFQVCFEGECLPPLPILNAYLRGGSSDLLADRLEGHDLYFKAVMRDGTELALSGPSLYDADMSHYQHLYNPLGGSLTWDGFELSENEFEVLIEVLRNSGFKMRIDDFGVLEATDRMNHAEQINHAGQVNHTDKIDHADDKHHTDKKNHADVKDSASAEDARSKAKNNAHAAHSHDFSAWFFAALDHARNR